jgi:hypothetical protein
MRYKIRMENLNLEEQVKQLKNIASSFNKDLFFGDVVIYIGMDMFMRKYVVLNVTINAIPEDNVDTFLNGVGATKEIYDTYLEVKELERLEREQELEKEKRERKERETEEIAKNKDDIQYVIDNFEQSTEWSDEVTYLRYGTDYDGYFHWTVVYAYYPTSLSRKLRVDTTQFKTLKEAM